MAYNTLFGEINHSQQKNLTHVAFSPDTVYDTFSDSFQQWRFSL